MKTILVPLDGSRLAEAVLPAVSRIAQTCGSTVTLLHIIERGAPKEIHGERHGIVLRDANDHEPVFHGALHRLASHGHRISCGEPGYCSSSPAGRQRSNGVSRSPAGSFYRADSGTADHRPARRRIR